MTSHFRYNSGADTGTLDSIDAGTVTAGTALRTNDVEPGTLSVDANVTATTNTLTMTVIWQVSTDNSTWRTVTAVNNAANIALATGTGSGVDGDKVYPAPECVFGWQYVRPAILSGGATGGANDTYTLTKRWARRQTF